MPQRVWPWPHQSQRPTGGPKPWSERIVERTPGEPRQDPASVTTKNELGPPVVSPMMWRRLHLDDIWLRAAASSASWGGGSAKTASRRARAAVRAAETTTPRHRRRAAGARSTVGGGGSPMSRTALPKAVVSESARRSATKAAALESTARVDKALRRRCETQREDSEGAAPAPGKRVEHAEDLEQRHQSRPVATAASAGEQRAASAGVELADHMRGRQQRRPGDPQERQDEEAISAE